MAAPDPVDFQDQDNIVLAVIEVVRCCRAIGKRLKAAEQAILGLDKEEADADLKNLPGQVHALSDKVDALTTQLETVTKAEADTSLHDQVAKLQVKMDKLLPDDVDPTIPPDTDGQ